jgi:tight adherence protein C
LLVLILAVIVLVLLGGAFLVSFQRSKGVYDEYLEGVDKKEYVFRDFMPIGFFLNEKLPPAKLLPAKLYKYVYKYEAKIKSRILELHGAKYADYFLMIHNGNKTAIGLTISVGAALLSVIVGAQGDMDACGIFLFAAVAALIGMPLMADKGLNDKIEKRRMTLQKEFPDFINKLTLLVNAGMTISKAWEKIVTDNQKNTPLYREMPYAIECGEMRKNVAKRLGEEASTKILIPLMIMFVGIIIIVATPAILSFSSGM